MPTEIKCPNCGTEFEPNESIREEIRKEANAKAEEWKKKKEKEFADEKIKLQQQLDETQKTARQKETDFLRKEQELKNKGEEIDLTVQRILQKERERLSETSGK